jgi:hypothetical protein
VLGLHVANGALERPVAAEGADEVLALPFPAGSDHETAYKQSLLDAGLTGVDVASGHRRAELGGSGAGNRGPYDRSGSRCCRGCRRLTVVTGDGVEQSYRFADTATRARRAWESVG